MSRVTPARPVTETRMPRADDSSPPDGVLPRSSQSTSWAAFGFSAKPFSR